jgi:hypothetical protein
VKAHRGFAAAGWPAAAPGSSLGVGFMFGHIIYKCKELQPSI